MNKIEKLKILEINLRATNFQLVLGFNCKSRRKILANSGYDWINIDLEHAISMQKLPNLFRSIEQGDALPIVN